MRSLRGFGRKLFEFLAPSSTPERCARNGSMSQQSGTRLEALYCTMEIREPAPGVVLLTIEGTDIGEFGDAPFHALAPVLAKGKQVELFIDARRARGPSVDVSSEWMLWLSRHRSQIRRASMLTRSRLVRLSADLVRHFARLGDDMSICSDPAVFHGALERALDSRAN